MVDIEEAIKLRRNNLTLKEISRKLAISLEPLKKKLKEANFDYNNYIPDNIEEIIEAHRKGATFTELKEKFHYGNEIIVRWFKEKGYRHVRDNYTIIVKCSNCGKEKKAYTSNLEKHKTEFNFCSNKCKREHKKYNLDRVKKATKTGLKEATSYENKLIELIKENKLPYKYVGDGSLWFVSEKKYINPDFIRTDDQKEIIEVYAKFFKIKSFGSVEEYQKQRVKLLGNLGFKVIFLDETDMQAKNWKEVCLGKIINRR